jgi:hypothetical protein
MFDRVLGYFMTEPRRLENLGSTLASIGTSTILIGLIAHVAITATSALGNLPGPTSAVKSMVELYPSLTTWWIPESIVGGFPAVLLTASGLWLNATGRQIRRFFEH